MLGRKQHRFDEKQLMERRLLHPFLISSTFDVQVRRQLEQLVLFNAGEASRVTVVIELR
jgi:hypothetical protein